jgi:uncharacterized protein YjiK
MNRLFISTLLMLATIQVPAQEVRVNKQHKFPKTVPAGNYSGITWLGGDRYAVANDKSPTAGFHVMTILTDTKTGDIKDVKNEGFMTMSDKPNRDEEGICYVAPTNTVFVSSESDGQIIEYTLVGQQTGRKLNIPSEFTTTRSNCGFEALTYNASTHRFWTTTENTLKQDGAKPNIKKKIANLLRLQSFGEDLQPKEQYWYLSDSSAVESLEGKSILGVSGLTALDNGQIIVLEREIRETPKYIGSFVHVKLYLVNPSLQNPGDLLQKKLITEFRTHINLKNQNFANYEGICMGPKTEDGRQILLMVADSQNQYKGWLRDWFKTIVIPDIDFVPTTTAPADVATLLASMQAVDDDKNNSVKINKFLSAEERPNHLKFITSPPAFGSKDFDNDSYFYEIGKEQRSTPRGVQAALDEVQWMSKAFSGSAGFVIGPEECPEIFKLVEGAKKDANEVNKAAKDYYHRERPFVHFGEPSLVPEYDAEYADSWSYPSGHTVRGWVYAFTLALVVPDSTEALISRAQEYAINRVICGRHYKSDIDAALVEATAVMCRLMSNEAFQAQLARAREEYALIKEKKRAQVLR